jgi:hypothetical protein
MPSESVNVTREDLYEQVWSWPMMHLAKDYGVSGNALAKTCRRLGVPVPERGYWAKQQNGRKLPPKPPLLPAEEGRPTTATVTKTQPWVAALEHPSDPALIACVQSLEAEENRIRVSEQLRKPHPAVAAAWTPVLRPKPGNRSDAAEEEELIGLPVSASWEHRNRALRILDALVKGLEARGYPVTAAGVQVEGHTVKLALSTKPERTPHIPTAAERQEKAKWGRRIPLWDYSPGSLLTIHCDNYVWWRPDLRKRWSDTKHQRLEDMLDSVLVGLVALGVAMRQREDEQRAEKERQAELARQEAEQEHQARLTAAKRDEIIASARSLSDAGLVRGLIEAIEAKARTDGAPPMLEAWLQRARGVVAELDPLAAGLHRMLDRHEETAAEEAERRKPAPKPYWA